MILEMNHQQLDSKSSNRTTKSSSSSMVVVDASSDSMSNNKSHVRSPPHLYLNPIKSPSFESGVGGGGGGLMTDSNNSESEMNEDYRVMECEQRVNSQASNVSSSSSRKANGVNSVVELIKSRLRLRMIAFDFDYTILTIHTGGQWLDSASKLAEFVRPCFRELIPALLKSDLHVCIVTYSPQEKLIREVLKIAMKNEHDNIEELLSKVIIRGNSKLLLEQYGAEACYSNGKQIHISTCKTMFESRKMSDQQQNNSARSGGVASSSSSTSSSSPIINNSDILLIDDDEQNLRLAVENGHLAFQVGPHTRLADLYEFLSKCQQNKNV